jgi:hypothetical protein
MCGTPKMVSDAQAAHEAAAIEQARTNVQVGKKKRGKGIKISIADLHKAAPQQSAWSRR